MIIRKFKNMINRMRNTIKDRSYSEDIARVTVSKVNNTKIKTTVTDRKISKEPVRKAMFVEEYTIDKEVVTEIIDLDTGKTSTKKEIKQEKLPVNTVTAELIERACVIALPITIVCKMGVAATLAPIGICAALFANSLIVNRR